VLQNSSTFDVQRENLKNKLSIKEAFDNPSLNEKYESFYFSTNKNSRYNL
jgi:hypothetical protein